MENMSDHKHVGKECEICNWYIHADDMFAECSNCGKAFHKSCWDKEGRCISCGSTECTTGGYEGPKYVTPDNFNNFQMEAEESTSRRSILFNDIGGKIKRLSTTLTVMGILGGILLFIVMLIIDTDLILPGLVAAIAISLFSWVNSFILNGFGELISCSNRIEELLDEKVNKKNE